MPSINPYLAFDGNCREAFEFYRSVFGGELADVSPFSEGPEEMMGAPEDADKLMHVSLPMGDGQILMGSDVPTGMPATQFGTSVALSYAPDRADEGRRVFDALAAGGHVTMPYETQFWNADFGMCTDKFGINWMVNYAHDA